MLFPITCVGLRYGFHTSLFLEATPLHYHFDRSRRVLSIPYDIFNELFRLFAVSL